MKPAIKFRQTNGKPAPGSRAAREKMTADLKKERAEKASLETQKSVDSAPPVGVESSQTPITATELETKKMTLTYVGLSKNGKNAFYSGAAQKLRISLSAFPSKQAPETIEVVGEPFAPARIPKAKLTPEERKALRASQPKPTLAEKIARREAQLAKLKAKAAAEGSSASM